MDTKLEQRLILFAEISFVTNGALDRVGGKDIPVKKMWKYPIDLDEKYQILFVNSHNLHKCFENV